MELFLSQIPKHGLTVIPVQPDDPPKIQGEQYGSPPAEPQASIKARKGSWLYFLVSSGARRLVELFYGNELGHGCTPPYLSSDVIEWRQDRGIGVLGGAGPHF